MTSTKEILIKAKGLIDAPEKWHKGGAHKFNDALCMCAWAAVVNANNSALSRAMDVVHAQAKELGFSCVQRFNGHKNTTHEDIMALFDRAIAAA